MNLANSHSMRILLDKYTKKKKGATFLKPQPKRKFNLLFHYFSSRGFSGSKLTAF